MNMLNPIQEEIMKILCNSKIFNVPTSAKYIHILDEDSISKYFSYRFLINEGEYQKIFTIHKFSIDILPPKRIFLSVNFNSNNFEKWEWNEIFFSKYKEQNILNIKKWFQRIKIEEDIPSEKLLICLNTYLINCI